MTQENSTPAQSEWVETLMNTTLFHDMPPEDISLILTLGTVKKYAPNSLVLEEKMLNAVLRIILEGSVRVYLGTQVGGTTRAHEINLATLGPGSVLGEYSVIDRKPTSATVSTLTDSMLLEIKGKTLDAFNVSHPQLGMKFYKNLLTIAIERLRNMTIKFDSTVTMMPT